MKIELRVKGGFKRLEADELHCLSYDLREEEKATKDKDYKKLLAELRNKIESELARRARAKHIYVKFVCRWSGYGTSSAPERELGCEYRRLSREAVEDLPHYYAFTFGDGSKNYWTIEPISAEPPKHYKHSSYSNQVDEIIRTFAPKEGR